MSLGRGSVQQQESLNVFFGVEAAISRRSLRIDCTVAFFPHSNRVLGQASALGDNFHCVIFVSKHTMK